MKEKNLLISNKKEINQQKGDFNKIYRSNSQYHYKDITSNNYGGIVIFEKTEHTVVNGTDLTEDDLATLNTEGGYVEKKINDVDYIITMTKCILSNVRYFFRNLKVY